MTSPSVTPLLRKRLGVCVAFLAAATIALTGCSTTSDSPEDAAKVVELTDTGKEIEQVTVALPGSLANLYIGQESGILNYNIGANVLEGLVAQDSTGKVVPALAKSWTTPDDTTYIFTLRDDAKFQNGDPLTAQDVVFSIERAADPESSPASSYYMANFESVILTGDNEVTVKSKKPDATFLKSLSSAGALVVTQQKFWETHKGKAEQATHC